MTAIPARDLRNHTADILRRVEAGEEFEVQRNGQPIAKIIPLRQRRQWIPARELIPQLERLGPDPTRLLSELRQIAPDTTDDVPL
ncbi:MAG TPA: type II toxin-antitoxin system prevent-host-death family antitoxin [Jiangellaceae bacterium]|jgi:prevent-host-death family protein|nr:type II toxin-antitoxin system prevent-host-death family antitoxin [Jiangellaceae bacterium]